MRTFIALAVLLVGCQREHDVQILLGPNATTLSIGFRCFQDPDPTMPPGPSKLLLEKNQLDPSMIQGLQLVVDVVSFKGRVPGCRGEELVAACASGECSLPAHRDGTARYCVEIPPFPRTALADPPRLLQALRQQLVEDRVVVTDAQDGPVLLRAVLTDQPCAEIDRASNGLYEPLDGTRAVGCAYSCPLQLDYVDGPISLSFDTLTQMCEGAVHVCAGIPDQP